MQREIAYAKVNLALHVRRRRPDGYHELETAFAFCEDGDVVEGELAGEHGLELEGPFAGELDQSDNLVTKAAQLMAVRARLRLTKCLPVASGLGGGSADAAATLRLLARLSGQDLPPSAETVGLGADVPACVRSRTCRGEGIGDLLTPLASVAGMPILLVNPRVPLSTAQVFKAWDGTDRGPLGDWRTGRNDLEAAACATVPAIADVLEWLRERTDVTLARMSGSGATCFALFGSEPGRDRAAAAVPPDWWSLASRLR